MAPNTDIKIDGFGFLPRDDDSKSFEKNREIVWRYTLTNETKASVQLITLGAGIQSIRIPNKRNKLGDVVLGFDSIEGYLNNRYIGRIIGRVINRIAEGTVYIDGKKYQLSRNEDGLNHLNGGFCGFDSVNWNSYVLGDQVIMSHISYSGDEGYPGDILTQVRYSWSKESELRIIIRATSTKPTPVNITNYCLFNLAGHGGGDKELSEHYITVNADKWTFLDMEKSLPSGEIQTVKCTPYDLRLPTRLTKKKLYSVPGGGYNNNLCISSPSSWSYRFHARIVHPNTGRFLEIYSNQPGLQFYTGNDLPDAKKIHLPDLEDYCWGGCEKSQYSDNELKRLKGTKGILGKDGILYRRHGGFALTPQNYPDAVNLKRFPSCILYPGKIYNHEMCYKFGLIQET